MRIHSRQISVPAASVAIGVSIAIMAHWLFIPQTNAIYEAPGIVKFNTGLCMGLAGLALLLFSFHGSKTMTTVAKVCTWIVLAIALTTIAAHILGKDTGIDQLFVREKNPAPGTPPGRMSLAACIIFVMQATSMLMLSRKRLHLLVQIFLMSAFVFLSILLLVYAAQPTPVKLLTKPTAVYTIIGLLLLLVGTFFSPPLQYLRFTLQKRVAAFISFAILFLVVVFISFVQSSKRTDETAHEVEVTNAMLEKTHQIMEAALNIETGTRGFIISSEESFLAPYKTGMDSIYKKYDALTSLAMPDRISKGKLDSLKRLIDANVNLRKQQVAFVEAKNLDAIRQVFADGTNKILMDSLRVVLSDITLRANNQLSQSREINKTTISGTYRVILLFQVITALLLIFAFIAIIKNVRRRNKAEQEIRELNEGLEKKVEQKSRELVASELHFRNILDNLLEGVQIIGFDWRYKYVNDAFLKHAKYTREELEGFTVQEKYPGIENTAIYKVYEKCFKERVAIHLENEFEYPDGSQGWFELSFQPVPEGIFILSMDISERKKSELDLIDANKMLDRRAAELQSSNTELERFAYVASHDLQEPLRMVSSFLHLLERKLGDTLEPTHKQYIDFAVDGAERMKTLIQDLLQYSRVGTSKQDHTLMNCNEVMETVRSVLSISIQETNTQLVVHDLPVVKAAEAQMLQLFQNLIGNAIKYKSDKTPVIEIGCNDKGSKWEFFVKDNGIGIDPKFFDKIFIIFQRLHNKTEYSGTGIGLAICKKIVERHGGNLWVDSALGHGSTFYFTLPKAQ